MTGDRDKEMKLRGPEKDFIEDEAMVIRAPLILGLDVYEACGMADQAEGHGGNSGSERGDVLRGMIPINIQEGSNENQC